MSAPTLERLTPDCPELPIMPLDAGERLYSFIEIAAAPSYFVSDGDMIQLHCNGLEKNMDGYNPSGVHELKVHANDISTTKVVVTRTEEGKGAYVAESRFCRFEESGELTELDIPRKLWEDAAVFVLPDGNIVTSGVHVVWKKDNPAEVDHLFTEYYYGPSLEEQEYLGRSPNGHKDSRLAFIDGKLILYTRPQKRSYEGKIHYTVLEGIEELNGEVNADGARVAQKVYDRAKPVGAGIFADDGTGGGPNGAVDIGNGWGLVTCHGSRRIWESQIVEDEAGVRQELGEVKEYFGFMIAHHPESNMAYIFGPHAVESQFPDGEPKVPSLRLVVFPGNLFDVEVLPNEPEGHVIKGKSTYGLRDKDMYWGRWHTAQSIAHILDLPTN